VLFLFALGAAWFARQQQLTAQSRALAAHAEQALGSDRLAALDLATRGWRTAKTVEANLAVADAFPQLLASLIGHSDAVESAVFSPDGQRVVIFVKQGNESLKGLFHRANESHIHSGATANLLTAQVDLDNLRVVWCSCLAAIPGASPSRPASRMTSPPDTPASIRAALDTNGVQRLVQHLLARDPAHQAGAQVEDFRRRGRRRLPS